MTVKARIAHKNDPRLDPTSNPTCAHFDPDLFHPFGREDMWPEATVNAAKAICARCPLLAKCRLWAIESEQPHGILGGQTPKERRATVAREKAEREQAALLGQLLAERAGDLGALLAERWA